MNTEPVGNTAVSPKASLNKKRTLFIASISLVVVLAAIFLYSFIQPAVKDERIFVSNISANQAAISWVTDAPARKWVVLTEKGSNTPINFKDDKEKSFLPLGAFNLHYVTASNLKPDTAYQFKIFQDFKQTGSGTFTTSPKVIGVTVTKMVSGQILSAEKSPAPGVIVYLQLIEGTKQSTLLSAVTDKEGKWQANILGARTADLKEEFKIASRSAALVIAEAAKAGRFYARFGVDNKIQSLPNIILQGAKQ